MALSVDSARLLLEDFLPALYKMEEILSFIGLLYAGKLAATLIWDLLIGVRAHLWSRLWNKKLVQRYGSWAVVTGCTDGIGKAYAHELAKNGVNIILMSRTKAKLTKVAEEIEGEHGVKTEIIQVDFANGQPLYEGIATQLIGKDIGILVNNVGVMLSHPKFFGDTTTSEIWSHINVNMGAVTAMTNIILPGMLQRGKGAIVNIASIAASGPIPLMAIYAASKAYVDYFSQALESEYSGKGITVQTVNPSYVATNMTSFSKLISTPSLLTPAASTFASNALNTLGYTKRTTGYWTHGIQKYFVDTFCSTWLFMQVMKLTNKVLLHDYRKSHAH